MNKEKGMMIKINDFASIKRFADVVTQFESDVDIYHTNTKFFDAKSILAVIALDISKARWIEIVSDDNEEVNKFLEAMKEFACEE